MSTISIMKKIIFESVKFKDDESYESGLQLLASSRVTTCRAASVPVTQGYSI